MFAKRIPVTDEETAPDHVRSTANVFGLPAYCHHGVGSPGFGAWREVAAHTMTTNWVLEGEHHAFPLLYHWRLVPGPDSGESLHEDLAEQIRIGDILTGGRNLYFADFGLALSSRFDLSPAESAFLAQHRTYDRAYTLSYLVNALITALYGCARSEREAIITRYAPLASVVPREAIQRLVGPDQGT
ncbi:hypothetical protein [Streptomyces venezuelae]